MISRVVRCFRDFIQLAALACLIAVLPLAGRAAPFAAYVMDARDGHVIYQENANTRLHPASLTKMLTLYICFDAIRRGEITLDTPVKISANAANQAPSRLGLRAGQTIALRYLIRAAAVKSANDAAMAIGEAISGSQGAFADRMNRTAKALGMTNSTFKNPNGLTAAGHRSTAHDMAILGRHLFYDFPEYYNIFSRRTTDAGVATVTSTNKRFLDAYEGADGIKTGYTGPAGFNLVASAQRGDKRIIAALFGGTSTAQRNAKMAELLDKAFAEVPAEVALRKPVRPDLGGPAPVMVAANDATDDSEPDASAPAKTLRLVTAVATSIRPEARPAEDMGTLAVASNDAANADDNAAPDTSADIPEDVAEASDSPLAPQTAEVVPEPRPVPPPPNTLEAEAARLAGQPVAEASDATVVASVRPEPRPANGPAVIVADTAKPADRKETIENVVSTSSAPADSPATLPPAPMPKPRPSGIVFASVPASQAGAIKPEAPEVVSRMSTSGGRNWAITLGRYPSRAAAENILMRTALTESLALGDGLRKVITRSSGYDANFVGLTQDQADLACRRLQARSVQCFSLAP